MKQAFATLCAGFALFLVYSAFSNGPTSNAQAPAASATPDPFVAQLTSSVTGASFVSFASNATDMSADGRFVVVESNGDISTEKVPTLKPDGTPNLHPRNNEDGNREIFLIDYAQRRIFQITNTRSVPNPSPSPSPTPSPSPSPSPTDSPTPSPSPTATPNPTPEDPTLVKIEVSSNRPMISLAPPLVSGKRSYSIVFSSNAITLPDFDGRTSEAALALDGNQEIWVYDVPAVADVDLSTGADVPKIDLSGGTLTRITNTPASRVPSAGSSTLAPFIADDNREATISDNGNRIAFVSTRNLVANGNADFNPEIFFFNRTSAVFAQLTNTQDSFSGPTLFSVFNQNPSLSSDGSLVAFLSNGNLSGDNSDDGNGHGNAEVYLANYNGTSFSNVRQVTKTKSDSTQAPVNLLGPGRRLSRDGSVLAFESLATDPKANGTNSGFPGLFIYDVAGNAFQEIGTRPPFNDVFRFPTFTDYDSSLKPSTLIFASAVNFLPDGTFPTTASDGLNPNNVTQVFATQVQIPIPATPANTFARLTNPPVGAGFGGVRPLTSNTRKRIAFSEGGVELGGGNLDSSIEVFYLLSPTVLSNSPAGMQFFAGASRFGPIPSPSPSPSGSPTPSPSPSPSPTPSESPSPTPSMALGLAPGELTIVTSTVDLAPANTNAGPGDEVTRSPALPIELNGVSVSVNGAAAGLYFVGNSPKQINFVIPIGLIPSTNSVTVVINNNGTVLRQEIQVITSQPDLFTSTNDAGGRASVCNITNSMVAGCQLEPFSITSPDMTGTLVPTVLRLNLTGARAVTDPTSFSVTIGTISIVPNAIRPNPNMPGWDQLEFTLPDTLAGAGDVPIVVTFLGQVSSRSSDTAPHVTISP